jgi:hypothetical protein
MQSKEVFSSSLFYLPMIRREVQQEASDFSSGATGLSAGGDFFCNHGAHRSFGAARCALDCARIVFDALVDSGQRHYLKSLMREIAP